MQNFVAKGDRADVVAPAGGLVSGQFYIVGALFGVCQISGNQNDLVTIVRQGIFDPLPKAVSETWAQGDQLYWDNTNKVFTKTSAGNTKCGIAGDVAQSADATGTVILDRP